MQFLYIVQAFLKFGTLAMQHLDLILMQIMVNEGDLYHLEMQKYCKIKTIGFGRFSINQLTTNVPHHIETSQLICNANQLNTVSTMVLSRRRFLEGNYITFFWLWVFVYFVCLPLFFLIVPMSRFELIAKFEIQKVFMKSLVSYILRVQKLFTIKKCHQIKSSTNFGWWLVNTLLT